MSLDSRNIAYTSEGEQELRNCLRRAGFLVGDINHICSMSQHGIEKILKCMMMAGEYVHPSLRPGRM